jgi:hypothetical protein
MRKTFSLPDRRLIAALSTSMLMIACACPLRAAPEDDIRPSAPKPPKSIMDIRIPIPFSPDVRSNGCHIHLSPEETHDDLTEVPFWRLIEHAALGYAVRLTVDGADKSNAKIAPLDEDMRRLVLLFTLRESMAWRGDALAFFFESKNGAIAPGVRDALQAAGLARESAAFSKAIALFGENYPIDNDIRVKRFESPASDDRVTPFKRQMAGVSAEFGQRDSFSKSILEYVHRTPALWQRIEGLREKLSEDDRLRFLTIALQDQIDLWQPYSTIESQFAAFSKPRRVLFAIAAFNDEFKNGGVHQFFYNSEGTLAPEVYDAMLELGLTRQAAIFKRGLDMFSRPYIRETQRRRERDFAGDWSDWDKRLSGLTDEFYALDGGLGFQAIGGGMVVEGGPGIDYAMLKYARSHALLPC